MTETMEIRVRLEGYFRQEETYWACGCPSLEVYSQGNTEKEARGNLQEAVELWVESCMERNTLGRALMELGWHRVTTPTGAEAPDSVESISMGVAPPQLAETGRGVLGEAFPVEIIIPAYQAALLSGPGGADGVTC